MLQSPRIQSLARVYWHMSVSTGPFPYDTGAAANDLVHRYRHGRGMRSRDGMNVDGPDGISRGMY